MITSLTRNKLENFFISQNISNFKKRQIILHPEGESRVVFFIKSGFARAYTISESGEELTVALLKHSDLFPITAGIDLQNNYYLESVTSLESYSVSKERFDFFLKNNPEVFYELTTDILIRFKNLLSRMEYLMVNRAFEKVTSSLWICAQNFGEKHGSNVVLTLPLTHKDIATLSGLTRETTCLEMKKLERMGLVEKMGRFFVIRDLNRLQHQ